MTERAPSTTPAADATQTSGSEWRAARGERWRAQLSGMEATLAPVDGPLLEALRLDAPFRIADIGCGGGGTALSILQHAPAGSVVHGFDISPALIEAARARAGVDAPALAFATADMETAPPPDALYQRLVSRFGVMFFDDPRAAFTNLARWLEPGGTFAFAVWGPPDRNAWTTSVREVVARIVDVPPLSPDGPGPFRYADVDKLLTLLAQAGFGALDARTLSLELPIGGALSAADAARFALDSFASFNDLLTDAGGQAREAAQHALSARFAQHHTNGAVRLAASVHIVTGSRVRLGDRAL